MNRNIKKLANQTVYYGLSSIVGRILNFFLVPLYVRVFTEGNYGIYTNLYAYFTFLNILYTYGMETTYFRFVNQEGNSRRVFSTTTASLIFSTIIFSLLIYLGRNTLSSAMGYAGHPEYIIWILSILALDTLAVSSFSVLRYKERPIKFAVIKIINILINVVFNVFFLVICPYLLKHHQYENLYPFINKIYSPDIGIGYIFISNIIASAMTLLMLYKELIEFNFDIDLKLLGRMIRYSAPLIVVGFAGMVNDNLDRAILKHLLPYSSEQNDILLGIYGANAKLSVFMVLVIQAFRYAAEPFFFLQSKQSDAKSTYAEVMKYFIIMGLLIFLFINLYIDIFKHFIGSARHPRYYEGLGIVPILLMANLFLGIFYNLSIWYKLKDKTNLGAYISVFGAIITIAVNFIFIPKFGYFTSAWAKLICYMSMVTVSYFIGQRIYTIDYHLKRLGLYFLVALFIYFTYLLLHQFILVPAQLPLINFALATVLFLAFAAFCIYREKLSLLNLLKKRFQKQE